jgi:fluoride exporter
MRMVWYVALGSGVGGVVRLLLGSWVQDRFGGAFPLGTLVINLTGSFVLGFLLHYALETPAIGADARALLTTGLCGGYTTFSTFSYETIRLVEDGEYGRAALYVTASVVLALLATACGVVLARELLVLRRRW